MTDREKLVDILERYPAFFCDRCGEDDLSNEFSRFAAYLLANGVTVSNWRDAKTDPPKKWRDSNRRPIALLVHCEGDIVCIGYYIGCAKRWVAIGVLAPVTHWQPLPEPPKEE